eukprot:scaffold157729_cov59-Attheya_sp.AAC.2
MDTGLDDAAELCIWAIKALNDFDTAATTATPAAAVAATTSTSPDAASTFRDVAYFLWMAATKVIKPAGLTLNMLSASATACISSQQRRVFGPGTVPGALVPPPGLPPPPPGMSSTALNSTTLTNLDGTLGNLAQETDLTRTSKERATSANARALTKFSHLPKWTKNMILRATEPLPDDAMDENGDLISIWTTIHRPSSGDHGGQLQAIPGSPSQ